MPETRNVFSREVSPESSATCDALQPERLGQHGRGSRRSPSPSRGRPRRRRARPRRARRARRSARARAGRGRAGRCPGRAASARSRADPLEQRRADPDERRPFLDRPSRSRSTSPSRGGRAARPVRARRSSRSLSQPDERRPGGLGGRCRSAAIVIRPTTGTSGRPRSPRRRGQIASGDQPCLAASPEVFTWRQTGGGSGRSAAGRRAPGAASASRPRGPSRTIGRVFFALFPCKWPIRCQRTGDGAERLGLRPEFLRVVLAEVASRPARRAAATQSAGVRLVTATSVTADGVAPRPPRRLGDPRPHRFQVLSQRFRVHDVECSASRRGARPRVRVGP